METQARTTLVGLFTLGVILTAFAFVYWLQNYGGFRQRAVYMIAFGGGVSGLLPGSTVLFNGIRVGEITGLRLNPQHPQGVTATIAIDPSAPVRSDTRVGLDFQGLTGAPVIVLSGGDASSPPLTATGDVPPTLHAPADAGNSLSQAARDTLARLDAVLSDNAKPLHDTVANLRTFSDALARNSDHVDGIIAGLERLTGGAGSSLSVSYELTAGHAVAVCARALPGQIFIPEPVSSLALNTDRIFVSPVGGAQEHLDGGKWTDNLSALIQAKTIQSFEDSDCFEAVVWPIDGLVADYQILLEVRSFTILPSPSPVADVELSARVLVGTQRIAASKLFHETASVSAMTPAAAVAGLDVAFGNVLAALVPWVYKVVAESPAERAAAP